MCLHGIRSEELMDEQKKKRVVGYLMIMLNVYWAIQMLIVHKNYVEPSFPFGLRYPEWHLYLTLLVDTLGVIIGATILLGKVHWKKGSIYQLVIIGFMWLIDITDLIWVI